MIHNLPGISKVLINLMVIKLVRTDFIFLNLNHQEKSSKSINSLLLKGFDQYMQENLNMKKLN